MTDAGIKKLREIVAEMRGIAKLDAACRDMIPRSNMALGMRTYADRLDAALASEAELADDDQWAPRHEAPTSRAPTAPGDAAAMREALEKIKKLNRYDLGCIRSRKRRDEFDAKVLEIERIARAALSAPARNCDKYGIDNIKEMDADFGAFCRQYGAKDGENCVGCPIKPMDNLCCHSAWMLLPAEGGAK